MMTYSREQVHKVRDKVAGKIEDISELWKERYFISGHVAIGPDWELHFLRSHGLFVRSKSSREDVLPTQCGFEAIVSAADKLPELKKKLENSMINSEKTMESR